jgi:hypothetical protein
MSTVIAYHEIKDAKHWLSSPKREEFFGPLGVTNIRTFVDPQTPTRAAVLMDVPDLDKVIQVVRTPQGPTRWITTACCPRRWWCCSTPPATRADRIQTRPVMTETG